MSDESRRPTTSRNSSPKKSRWRTASRPSSTICWSSGKPRSRPSTKNSRS